MYNLISRKPYLATGGGDQSCCVWDYKAKRRVFTQREFPTSVSALVFNSDGSMLGVATSYLYENGQKAYVLKERKNELND